MRRLDLVPDCGSCAAICCVATPFDASDDFAFDKGAGVRCRHLTRDCRCAIHGELAEQGFAGCAAYDCYGAGQHTTRAFAEASERHEAFFVLRSVHELLWLLTEAMKLCPRSSDDLATQLARQIDLLDDVARTAGPALFEADLRSHEEATYALLRRVGDALGGRAQPR